MREKLILVPILALGLLIGPGRFEAHPADGAAPRGVTALIVVGLAGDDEHEALFRRMVETWQRWLTDSLQFPADGVRVLFGERRPELGHGPGHAEGSRG